MKDIINKIKVPLGLLLGAIGYLLLLVLAKVIFGLDVCTLTQDIPALQTINNFILSNVYIECAYRTLMFTFNLFFVFSICTNTFDFKKNFIICAILFVLNYVLNLLIYFFKIPPMLVSSVIPLILVLLVAVLLNNGGHFTRLNSRLNSFLTALIHYVLFYVLMLLIQQGVMFLTLNVFKFAYLNTNIFNSILININLWVIYFSIYFVVKILYKRRLENGR